MRKYRFIEGLHGYTPNYISEDFSGDLDRDEVLLAAWRWLEEQAGDVSLTHEAMQELSDTGRLELCAECFVSPDDTTFAPRVTSTEYIYIEEDLDGNIEERI